jgi:uncharacterized membrane protein
MSDQPTNDEKSRLPSNPIEPSRKDILPPALESALRSLGVDPTDPKISKALEISLTMMFSGSLPLAPPPILREYGNIRPELIDKLIEWTEQQSAHRREMERCRTTGSEKRQNRGQLIGAVVMLGGLSLAAVSGHASQGSTASGSSGLRGQLWRDPVGRSITAISHPAAN